ASASFVWLAVTITPEPALDASVRGGRYRRPRPALDALAVRSEITGQVSCGMQSSVAVPASATVMTAWVMFFPSAPTSVDESSRVVTVVLARLLKSSDAPVPFQNRAQAVSQLASVDAAVSPPAASTWNPVCQMSPAGNPPVAMSRKCVIGQAYGYRSSGGLQISHSGGHGS